MNYTKLRLGKSFQFLFFNRAGFSRISHVSFHSQRFFEKKKKKIPTNLPVSVSKDKEKTEER